MEDALLPTMFNPLYNSTNKALLQVQYGKIALGLWQETNSVQKKSECYIGHKTHSKVLFFFIMHEHGGA